MSVWTTVKDTDFIFAYWTVYQISQMWKPCFQKLLCFFKYNKFLYLSTKKPEICIFCAYRSHFVSMINVFQIYQSPLDSCDTPSLSLILTLQQTARNETHFPLLLSLFSLSMVYSSATCIPIMKRLWIGVKNNFNKN